MVKIKSMIRKSVNCLVTLSLMFFVFLFVYACSSDADYSAKIEDIDRNLLIKSVAESDVFLDFILEAISSSFKSDKAICTASIMDSI